MIDSAETRAAARDRLARALEIPVERLDYLADVPTGDLDALLHLVYDHFFSVTEDGLGKIVAATRVLPPPVAAKVASHNNSALMTAHLAAVLEPARALSVAKRLRPELLARVAAYLDLHRSAALIAGLPVDLAVAIARTLADRQDWLTLGTVMEVATATQLERCLRALDVEEILSAARLVYDPAALDRLAAVTTTPLSDQLRALHSRADTSEG